MALIKTYELPTGDTGEYWRVRNAIKDKDNKRLSFSLILFKSKDSAINGKVGQSNWTIVLQDDLYPCPNCEDKCEGKDLETLIYCTLKSYDPKSEAYLKLPTDFRDATSDE